MLCPFSQNKSSGLVSVGRNPFTLCEDNFILALTADDITEGIPPSNYTLRIDHTGGSIDDRQIQVADRVVTTAGLEAPGDWQNTSNNEAAESNIAILALRPSSQSSSSTTKIRYIHTDHLGGTNIVTDEDQDVVQTIDYYPFGEERIETGTHSEQRQYTGHEKDDDTDLTYAEQRYYDQDVGRWISQDPAFLAVGRPEELVEILDRARGQAGEFPNGLSFIESEQTQKEREGQELQQFLANPQQLNSYSYAVNNPLKIVDPKGEIGFVPALLVVLGAYGLVDLGVTAYDFNTVVLQYPEQFSEQEINDAGASLLFKAATMGITRLPGVTATEALIIDGGSAALDVLDFFFAPEAYKDIQTDSSNDGDAGTSEASNNFNSKDDNL